MKKIMPYFIFSTAALAISFTLSYLLDFSLTNSWQGEIALAFFFGPYFLFAWKKARANKEKNPIFFWFLAYCLVLFIVGLVICTVAFYA